jgi:hypothetical protein
MALYRKVTLVVPPGEYEVKIVNGYDKVSHNGNAMMVFRLTVEGLSRSFVDCIVFTESSDWKIAAFLAAMGIRVSENDEIDLRARDFVGRTGRAVVGVHEYRGSSENCIVRWVPAESKAQVANPPPTAATVQGEPNEPAAR